MGEMDTLKYMQNRCICAHARVYVVHKDLIVCVSVCWGVLRQHSLLCRTPLTWGIEGHKCAHC